MTIMLGIVTVIIPSAIPYIVLATIEIAKNTPAVLPTYEANPKVPVAIVIRSIPKTTKFFLPKRSMNIPTIGEVIKNARG